MQMLLLHLSYNSCLIFISNLVRIDLVDILNSISSSGWDQSMPIVWKLLISLLLRWDPVIKMSNNLFVNILHMHNVHCTLYILWFHNAFIWNLRTSTRIPVINN